MISSWDHHLCPGVVVFIYHNQIIQNIFWDEKHFDMLYSSEFVCYYYFINYVTKPLDNIHQR